MGNGESNLNAVRDYVKAFCTGEQAASDAAAKHLADDIDLVSPPLHVYGRAGIIERISGHWPGMGMYQQATWSEPEADGSSIVRIGAQMPPDMPMKSLTLTFTFDDAGKICHVEQAAVRGTPPTTALALTDEIKRLVNESLDNECPMILGYMGKDGQPQISLRGSMRAISDTQLAFWSRNPAGGAVQAIEYNPKMTVLYRDTPHRVNMLFQGSARVETDEGVRSRVFETMPQIEQDHDEPRRGACIVIDLETVNGATFEGPVRMAR